MPRHGKCMCFDCVDGRARRQEIRHGGVAEEELPHISDKKDTKRWCKGKVGRKHDFVWEAKYLNGRPWYRQEACIRCGKQRDWKLSNSIFDY